MRRLYLYLANRNKQGIKLITVLQGEKIVNSKVTDVTLLKLPQIWERKIAVIVHEHRMHYDLHVESAYDFNELRDKLAIRGYADLPMGTSFLLDMRAYSLAPIANTANCPSTRSMLQKKN
jgi:hypothetical protein